MADLDVNRRLERLIRDVYQTSIAKFASKYEKDSKAPKTYRIIHLKNGISPDMLDSILNAYPEVNRKWLLTGEGDMIISDNEQKVHNTSDVTASEIVALASKYADIIVKQTEIIGKLNEKIEVLEKKSENLNEKFG